MVLISLQNFPRFLVLCYYSNSLFSVFQTILLSFSDSFSWYCYNLWFSPSINHYFQAFIFHLIFIFQLYLIVFLYRSFLLHRSKRLRSLLVEFILSFISFFHLSSWGFAIFVLKPSFLSTTHPAAFYNLFLGWYFQWQYN